MKILSQCLSPLAFDVFQFTIGGTVAKRHLVLGCYRNQRRVLEIGCSTGNIASAFLNRDMDYTGLDIDGSAIDYAKIKFRRHPNFHFVCGDLRNLNISTPFDLILFSGILHHIEDAVAREILELSASFLSSDGYVCVSDPLTPKEADSWLVKLYRKMERGKFVRSWEQLSQLLTSLRGLKVEENKSYPVTALPVWSRPTVSYFGVFLLRHKSSNIEK
jgi:SAM-dependent methyltransferase